MLPVDGITRFENMLPGLLQLSNGDHLVSSVPRDNDGSCVTLSVYLHTVGLHTYVCTSICMQLCLLDHVTQKLRSSTSQRACAADSKTCAADQIKCDRHYVYQSKGRDGFASNAAWQLLSDGQDTESRKFGRPKMPNQIADIQTKTRE